MWSICLISILRDPNISEIDKGSSLKEGPPSTDLSENSAMAEFAIVQIL